MKIAFLAPLLLLCSVTRADVRAVRREVASINAQKLVVKTSDRSGLSTEGAKISIYRNSQKAPRKIVTHIYGESGQLQEMIYLRAGAPLFLFSLEERYESLLTATSPVKIASRTETRLYFDKGRLIEKRVGKKRLALSAAQKRSIEKATRDAIKTYLSPSQE